ncbi:MAG: hypothetical protein OYG32_09960 [Rhodospirillaceae bacterium]|nr:hypothetical protein [Rhodospirillaceae bacterium]MDE0255109.1 hypothetical protein [Rhodospirillaceae bacterium]MDE0619118.1 hypothetical protein [Rhodospirillaceae bacterium]MDE0704441.1 hypothetical protein [Rhodospirillaceae bacterium]
MILFARVFERQAARATSPYERNLKLKLAAKARELAGTRGAEAGDHAE